MSLPDLPGLTWFKMRDAVGERRRRLDQEHAKIVKHAAGVVLDVGHQDTFMIQVDQCVDVGVNPGDLPRVPSPALTADFLVVIKPVAIFHPAAWPLNDAGGVMGDLVMTWAKEMGRPLYFTHSDTNWLFVTIEPFPEGMRTVCRALATPEGIWELID